jgi:hypothetical protein
MKQIIPIIMPSLLVILIIKDYIVIRKPYKYLFIFMIILGITFLTPVVNHLNKDVETIFVTLYTVFSVILLICFLIKDK